MVIINVSPLVPLSGAAEMKGVFIETLQSKVSEGLLATTSVWVVFHGPKSMVSGSVSTVSVIPPVLPVPGALVGLEDFSHELKSNKIIPAEAISRIKRRQFLRFIEIFLG
jgi:hypothetical protein